MRKNNIAVLLLVLLVGMALGAYFSTPAERNVAGGGGDRSGYSGTVHKGTPGDRPGTSEASGEHARVIRVIDGDTIEVLMEDGRTEKVRYIGVDTPERGRPFYHEATDFNRKLVGGREVVLVRDVSERDRYGRLLRYVYVGDVFVNAELVREGYAMPLTIPPDVSKADEFVRLAREAREAGRGLWGR